MPRTPHDLLADYLEAQSLLESLRLKRARLMQHREGLGAAEREDAPEASVEGGPGASVVREDPEHMGEGWGFEGEQEFSEALGPVNPALLKGVEAGIEKAQALLLEYERHIELHLQGMADDADRGRVLFLEVSKRMVEFQSLVRDLGKELNALETAQWKRMVEDYRKLRREWVVKLPPEECPPFPE